MTAMLLLLTAIRDYKNGVTSNGMMFIPSLIKICVSVQKLLETEKTHRYDETVSLSSIIKQSWINAFLVYTLGLHA
jgi:hypothetical protein